MKDSSIINDSIAIANKISAATEAAEKSISDFQILLIISEIGAAAIALYGFYRIFNSFNKKNKEFIDQAKKEKGE